MVTQKQAREAMVLGSIGSFICALIGISGLIMPQLTTFSFTAYPLTVFEPAEQILSMITINTAPFFLILAVLITLLLKFYILPKRRR